MSADTTLLSDPREKARDKARKKKEKEKAQDEARKKEKEKGHGGKRRVLKSALLEEKRKEMSQCPLACAPVFFLFDPKNRPFRSKALGARCDREREKKKTGRCARRKRKVETGVWWACTNGSKTARGGEKKIEGESYGSIRVVGSHTADSVVVAGVEAAAAAQRRGRV